MTLVSAVCGPPDLQCIKRNFSPQISRDNLEYKPQSLNHPPPERLNEIRYSSIPAWRGGEENPIISWKDNPLGGWQGCCEVPCKNSSLFCKYVTGAAIFDESSLPGLYTH
ncbi:hypothetical protein CEXT_119761 [Caerostris extrusa]|uniref:Uncharacterized protein n=1 Tax=Caerostris extrusa TaxID=172846 RepID=A0AAV4U4V9_CAEEX|nr:hypothetical protein CEXT_119761 [Caerostris extrusa]